VVQDVFARIWERGGRLDCRDPVQYLFRAARNRAISYLRHEQAVGRLEANITARASALPPSTTELEYEELSAAIEQAIAALPERCRLVYTLSRDQEMTYAEIARTLGISVKTVEVQMYRAFKALRRRVAPYLAVVLAVRLLAL
jgi:RNA polymerase sigma-70 factor (ECF subfamily)